MQSIPKTGSSETIRKTTFNFSRYKQDLVSHKKHGKIDPRFLEWFVGFSEADLSFICSKTRLFFVISQKEEKILHRIRTELGFGKVSTYKDHSRFIVADRNNIRRLIHLFNGNLVSQNTNIRFGLWLQSWNLWCRSTQEKKYLVEKLPDTDISTTEIQRYQKIQSHAKQSFVEREEYITPLARNQLDSFDTNAWLSGFTDAYGSFNAVQTKDSTTNRSAKTSLHGLGLRFILDQKSEKDVLEKVRTFFESGVVYQRKKEDDMWRFTCTSLSSHRLVLSYFNRYPLRTFKKVSFLRFSSLFRSITKRSVLSWQGTQSKALRRVYRRVESLIKKSSRKVD
ncbi:MAG: hypothetical protein EOP45_04495 [Sphingobacteriaceae bacterium]|nr:MAG: hypothetical protein EOP45_04495 [Sphingobacteriaceae bacterium]